MSVIYIDDTNYDALMTFLFRPDNLSDYRRYGASEQLWGTILKQTNKDSYSERYREERSIVEYKFKEKSIPDELNTPVTIIKLCDYYEYQSCEAPNYDESEAKKIIDKIRYRATRELAGYDAAPWGMESIDSAVKKIQIKEGQRMVDRMS